MELKATVILAILATLAVSANARRDDRGGMGTGRERGEGRFGGRPDGVPMGGPRRGDGGVMDGRRFDGPRLGLGAPQMDQRRQFGGPMGGGRRSDGPFRGSRPEGVGRPFFGQDGTRRDGGEEETADASKESKSIFDRFGLAPISRGQSRGRGRLQDQGEGQHNDSSEEDGGHRHHRYHPHHHHHRHNHTEGHRPHNKTGDYPHRHHNKTGDGDWDRPRFQMRPFRFFKNLPFGRHNRSEEGSHGHDGRHHPFGNRGRWGSHESEEEEEQQQQESTTRENATPSSPSEVITPSSQPEVIEIAINDN
ncbi:serine/threonine-protein phosphatase 1 regulatory subunit 10-like [Lytechinus pictus]|uniref:serine/threonine-protein phosphatase 1 regulatory subunit 10-like n=1 Tax=Lytechinus pictus TaxID=7653 RepID=UPI0030B9B785